ncbi:hypothetical protein TPAR_07492 [Tolypocladium paradoxum]|uniref:Uncharacterized protein n=1 Tax=Tolypocladium paradoxum TaxID=94208 RepID=A0A2S4KQ35_9HYPO|nr:hypothetical protein TPAR_07492 [Tolypocladium paradoxum]
MEMSSSLYFASHHQPRRELSKAPSGADGSRKTDDPVSPRFSAAVCPVRYAALPRFRWRPSLYPWLRPGVPVAQAPRANLQPKLPFVRSRIEALLGAAIAPASDPRRRGCAAAQRCGRPRQLSSAQRGGSLFTHLPQLAAHDSTCLGVPGESDTAVSPLLCLSPAPCSLVSVTPTLSLEPPLRLRLYTVPGRLGSRACGGVHVHPPRIHMHVDSLPATFLSPFPRRPTRATGWLAA